MERIDAQHLGSEVLNEQIRQALAKFGEVEIDNPHSMHNIAVGLKERGRIVIKGSTGFYTGGFMDGPAVTLEGNAGWYVGDNMMGGELVVTQNTGSNAGVYLTGGTLVIRGGTGSRVGYGMKGGTIIVCGAAGRWAGQMTTGGRLVLLGPVGRQVGESMYLGALFVADPEIEGKLGGNVFLDEPTGQEAGELNELFARHGISVRAESLRAVRPSLTGRHTYVLFKPELHSELSASVLHGKGAE